MANASPASTKGNPPKSKRVLPLAALGLIAVMCLLVIAARVFIKSSAGHGFIEAQVNSRSFGPIKSVKISGLDGDVLSEFSVSNIQLFDKEGLWLDLKDLSMSWSPAPLLKRHIDISSLLVDDISVTRRPDFNPDTPNGKPITLSVPDITLERVALSEALMGMAAQFNVQGGAVMTSNENQTNLTVRRIDSEGDVLILNITQKPTGIISGQFDISGAANGALATLVKAPDDSSISGKGEINGTLDTGAGKLDLTIGSDLKSQSSLSWDKERISLESTSRVSQWPGLSHIITKLGNDISLSAQITRQGRNFETAIKTNTLTALATGVLPEDSYLPDRAKINVSSENPEILIAFPDGFSLGRTQISGLATLKPSPEFDGTIISQNITSPWGEAAKLSGPLSVRKINTNSILANIDFEAKSVTLDRDLPLGLGTEIGLKTEGIINLSDETLKLKSAELLSGATSVRASGEIDLQQRTLNLSGNVNTTLQPAEPLPAAFPPGALSADYTLQKTSSSGLAITTSGAFSPENDLPEPFDQLVGPRINFETEMSPLEDGIAIKTAIVTAQNMSIATSGSITEQININLEGETRAPFSFEDIQVGEATSLTAKISGTRNDPSLRLQAEASEIIVSDQMLTGVKLKVDLTQFLQAPQGPVEISGETAYGFLLSSVAFISNERGTLAQDISISLGELQTSGQILRLNSGLLEGELKLDLPDEGNRYARAILTLAPQDNQTQGLNFSAKGRGLAYKTYAIDSLDSEVSGTFSKLSGRLSMKGQKQNGLLSDPILLDTPISFSKNNSAAYVAAIKPKGRFGQLTFDSAAPVTAGFNEGEISLEAPLMIRKHPMNISYQRSANGFESLKLRAQNMPISLLPLPELLEDTRGRWSTALDMSTKYGSPSGTLSFALSDWRGFGRDKEKGLNFELKGDLRNSSMRLELEGQSAIGFDLSGNLELPIKSQNTLVSLRPKMQASLLGELTANGPAQAILSLIADADTDIAGTLLSNLTISGTANAPRVQGEASGDGLAFELTQAGSQFRNGEFEAEFSNDSFSVPRIYFEDREGGTLQGSGGFKLGEFGRPIGEINLDAKKIKLMDRNDYGGTASGNIEFVNLADKASVTGALVLDEVEVKNFTAAAASVIVIDVEEINAPPRAKTFTQTQQNTVPIIIDLSVKAPRKIFIRSRGLDAELSIDTRLMGTVNDIDLKGQADIIRGSYKLAGKTIEIDTGSIVFDGPISQGDLNLTAKVETTNINAEIIISGTVEKPEIELSSTPARPEDEILSAILFSRSATELSALEAAQLAATLAQLSGSGGGLDLLGGLRDTLGIAELGVSFDENGGAIVTGGRYLADNVYLQIFSGASSNQTGAVIDWELRKDLSLRSQIQSDNDQSISLSYKKDF